MKLVQPYDGRPRVPIFTPAPVGYRVYRAPREKKTWTFCERHINAMAVMNRLRSQGYSKARIEPLLF